MGLNNEDLLFMIELYFWALHIIKTRFRKSLGTKDEAVGGSDW